MPRPGEKRILGRPAAADGSDLAWVEGAVQTMFGQQGAGAGQTLFGPGAAGQGGPDLSALATDILLIGVKIAAVENHGSPESLQRLIMAYFREFDRACLAAGKAPDLVEHARYALTAYIDEAVIAHSAACRDFWIAEPLQVRLFQDNNAGENFFFRLEQLLKDIRRNCETLEVYYLALALGFQGRYRLQGAEKLPIIISNLLLKIEGVRGVPPKAISPSANVHPGRRMRERTGRPLVLTAAGLLLAAVLYYLALMALAPAPLDPARDAARALLADEAGR